MQRAGERSPFNHRLIGSGSFWVMVSETGAILKIRCHSFCVLITFKQEKQYHTMFEISNCEDNEISYNDVKPVRMIALMH